MDLFRTSSMTPGNPKYSSRVCYELTTNTKHCRSSLRGPTLEFHNTNTSRVAPVHHSCTVLNCTGIALTANETKARHLYKNSSCYLFHTLLLIYWKISLRKTTSANSGLSCTSPQFMTTQSKSTSLRAFSFPSSPWRSRISGSHI